MDLKSIIGAIAPTIATVLGGPLAGLAVDALGKAFGMEAPTVEKVKDIITKGQLTGDQIIALKQAEQDLTIRLKELDIDLAKIDVVDRDSARRREVDTRDSTNKRLAYIIVGAFIGLVAATILGYAKVESALAGTLVGYLSAKCEQVLAYYFGSSKGSSEKTALLAKAEAIKE